VNGRLDLEELRAALSLAEIRHQAMSETQVALRWPMRSGSCAQS
jgi:hypothetical protein